jgi:hypothetical protein
MLKAKEVIIIETISAIIESDCEEFRKCGDTVSADCGQEKLKILNTPEPDPNVSDDSMTEIEVKTPAPSGRAYDDYLRDNPDLLVSRSTC